MTPQQIEESLRAWQAHCRVKGPSTLETLHGRMPAGLPLASALFLLGKCLDDGHMAYQVGDVIVPAGTADARRDEHRSVYLYTFTDKGWML